MNLEKVFLGILLFLNSADTLCMGKVYNLSFFTMAFVFVLGCSPTKNSLLTDWKSSDPCETTNCINRTSTESDLFVQPTLSTKSIKAGALTAEIDGKCSSSFYSEHRIVVKIYAGTGVSGSPISENDSYIVSTNGHMLTELGKFFPQCIRGKFSFLIPLFNPSSPLTPITSIYAQFYLTAIDTSRGEVNSPIASSLINLY